MADEAVPRDDRRPTEDCDAAGRCLIAVFEALDRADIPYCVTHGYLTYPYRIASSDVDILISADLRPGELVARLNDNGVRRAGARFIYARGGYLVLATTGLRGAPRFVALDMASSYEIGSLRFYDGREIVENRCRHAAFWIPPPDLEFGCYLVRRIAKGDLGTAQGQRLSALYAQDPAGCQRQIAGFWGRRSAEWIGRAAHTGNWRTTPDLARRLRHELCVAAFVRRPRAALGNLLRQAGRRLRLAWRPEGGLSIVLLGPDGAGKSSIAQAIIDDFRTVFPRSGCDSFPPAVLGRLRGAGDGSAAALPHAAAPRSRPMSVLRAAGYWAVYQVGFYRLAMRLRATRSCLTVHDRHLVDTLVDPLRYRYQGPDWLLRLVWRLGPKPDLVILLDASPEVLQARKQEVPLAESARQCEAYRALVATMDNGRVVDARRPFEEVSRAVDALILEHLQDRLARRLLSGKRGVLAGRRRGSVAGRQLRANGSRRTPIDGE